MKLKLFLLMLIACFFLSNTSFAQERGHYHHGYHHGYYHHGYYHHRYYHHDHGYRHGTTVIIH